MAKRRYRRVQEIDAEQWADPENPPPEVCSLLDAPAHMLLSGSPPKAKPHVHTLEGAARIDPGDWVATGAHGEAWPINDDVFHETYKPVGR